MTPVNLVAPRWAVSGRTHGEVLTAGVSTSGLEIVLLGVPQGFTPAEVEGWLHDLSGVAIETSRTDTRERPIPAALHHALTGLLFSQAELWGRASANPCSAAFVDGPEGLAFGWVGEGSVTVLVEGIPTEPRWVLVRDENGNVLPPQPVIELTNLTNDPAYADIVQSFRTEVAQRWNVQKLHQDILASQRQRQLVSRALMTGKITAWDYQPVQDAAQQYVRNNIELWELMRRTRFPAVEPPTPRRTIQRYVNLPGV